MTSFWNHDTFARQISGVQLKTGLKQEISADLESTQTSADLAHLLIVQSLFVKVMIEIFKI